MPARIEPAARPYDDDMERTLEKLMPPGVEPLVLFRTLARNPRVFRRFMAGGLLDKGTLSLREREIVIDRACARCGGEYEWGVHIAFFGERVGFGPAEVAATVAPGADADCWNAREKLIVRLVDQLHDTSTVDDDLWMTLKTAFSDEQLLEMIVLAGLYHMVSFVVNATRLPLEDYAARFPQAAD
ncbi:carboxymuconolactone decarboxylase family protein [uncultured Parvibaculum sp.]|uniref:carboxymuconolactone decarboxylase family protein n=1 Tax=uncultured Parvibaculum sp. TaxID=291828 RepID=UPI0030DD0C66|tara:strand:- start:41073 stop:41627 length:555 start_codon:yes stop_codon:yes gene_type:complete